MSYNYYVLYNFSGHIEGPMTFKEATKIHSNVDHSCVILKKVIDEFGKEVK